MRSSPDTRPTPACLDVEGRVSAAFQRGKTLTGIVVAGSIVFWLWDVVGQLPWFDSHGGTSIFGGSIVLGLLCWSTWRGGKLGTGFLIFIYGSLFLSAVVGVTNQLLNWFSPVGSGLRFNLGTVNPSLGFEQMLTSGFGTAWIAFAFWTLVCSSGARIYRASSRQQAVLRESCACEWTPVRRL